MTQLQQYTLREKTSLLKKIETSPKIRQMFDTLKDANADQLVVGAAGNELFLHMYGGKESLKNLR